MGKAQSLNIGKLNKAKQEKALEEFNKIKKSYSKDLIEKYKFPSGSPEAKGLSNADLAKKYFGRVNVATISRVERLNNKLSKELNLSYPKGDETTYNLKRKKRLGIVQGGKYISNTDDFPFHHIMPIGGETAITTKDVGIISKQMNSKLAPYNRKLNDIADAVSNLYSERPEGFQKRVDELQKNAEQIINKVKKELPKKYQGLIGFTKLEPIYDEYGTILRLHGNRVGIDESKSIGGKLKKATNLADMSTKEIKTLIDKAPKFKANMVPGLENLVKVVESMPDDIKARRYWTAGLKSLGILGGGLIAYDGYQAVKQGLPPDEVIAKALLGADRLLY